MRTILPLNPPRRMLFGPGPSMVDPRVYEELAKPIVGHLDPFFFGVLEDTAELLREVFGTRNRFTMVMSGTGSAGMEAAVANFAAPGSKLAVFANGYFCDRISEMGRRQGAQVVRFEKKWGEAFSDDEASEWIHREKPATVAFVHVETSTGVVQAAKAICTAAHEVGALTIADCVTSLGGMPVEVDANGIDVAYSCSQKALSCPPGLAPITVSERALERLHARQTSIPEWYLDLQLLEQYFTSARRYHHTLPISMFYALRRALGLIAEEGLQARWDRHRRSHLAFVAGIEAMDLRMHVPEGRRAWTLNTPVVPDGIDDAKVRRRLLDEDGIEVLGGFGPLAGKVLRVGLMGLLATDDCVAFLLERLEKALRAEGYAR
ncbi:MAG TPA: alanine--glyoxylate aminotransferase family protein [Bryobacteraceae bacterium]|nr:alanine--glyoxylate aminotransferase family protein [Bryobacteraceae bacterium]